MDDSMEPYVPNHRGEYNGPAFQPAYYQGEEIEHQQLRFTNEPLGASIDGYFDYNQPMIIRNENQSKLRNDVSNKNGNKAFSLSHTPSIGYGPSSQISSSKKVEKRPVSGAKQVQRPKSKQIQASTGNQGWNSDTKTDKTFDGLKKNELFGFRRGQPESRNELAEKVVKQLANQVNGNGQPNSINQGPATNVPMSFADVVEIEKLLTKENANTVKSIIKTNESKLKLLEEQLRKEELENQKKNKDYMNKVNELMTSHKNNEDYIRKMKKQNDNVLAAHGFRPTPAKSVSLANQLYSDVHPIAAPKTKSSGYGKPSKQKKKRQVSNAKFIRGVPKKRINWRGNGKYRTDGKVARAQSAGRYPPQNQEYEMASNELKPNLHYNRFAMDEDPRKQNVTWADQLDEMKQGYEDNLSMSQHLRPSSVGSLRQSNLSQVGKGTVPGTTYQQETADFNYQVPPQTRNSDLRNSRHSRQSSQSGNSYRSSKPRSSSYKKTQRLSSQPKPIIKSSGYGVDLGAPLSINPPPRAMRGVPQSLLNPNQNLQNLRANNYYEPGSLPLNSYSNHVDDLGRIENQLNNMRQELKPIMKALNKPNRKGGPTVDLMQASVGRLMKIHSDKLVNMMVDDMIVEMIAILNEKEEMEHRRHREKDVKDMALALCDELNQIDIDQRFIHEANKNGANRPGQSSQGYQGLHHIKQTPIPHDFGLQILHGDSSNIPVRSGAAPGQASMTYNHYSGKNLPLSYPVDIASAQGLKSHQMANAFISKGPYKDQFAPRTKLSFSAEQIQPILRDQIMNEDRLNKIPFLRKANAEASAVQIDHIVDSLLGEVMQEMEQAEEEFVKGVIKGEFN